MGTTDSPGGGQEAFDRLLEALDNDRDRAGDIYESLRRRTLTYFRMHGFPDAHDLFDQTMDRAARRLSETRVANITAYIIGIARLVCFEAERSNRREIALDDVLELPETRHSDDEDPKRLDSALECLEQCVAKLSGKHRLLILNYYSYSKGEKVAVRESMADDLHTSSGALRVRLHRIRRRLEACVTECLNGGAPP